VKKLISLLFCSLLILPANSCSKGDNPKHIHTFSDEWSSNDSHHWHSATCEHTDETSSKEQHCFSAWQIDKFATTKTNGLKLRKCLKCSYKQEEVIPIIHDDSFCEILDISEKESIFNFCVDYELNNPGTEISYNILWTGFDTENKFGPNIPKENRFYTYLTEYEDNEDFYFLLYIKKEKLLNFDGWFENYKNGIRDSSNYHFDDDVNILDGKFLLYAQQNNVEDYSVYYTSNPLDAINVYKEQQLAICLQFKNIKILENISSDYKIEKELIVLRRYELFFNKSTNSLEKYSFVSQEKSNVKYVDTIFSFHGRRIETYPISFENMSYCYCPSMGMDGTGLIKSKRANLIDDYMILPRYASSPTKESESLDLLDPNCDFSFIEDVYRDFKSQFLKAFVEDYFLDDGFYKYGLFDYSMIKDLIKNNGKNYD